MTISWKEDAIKNLHNSLHPVKVELNELDWKCGFSEKSERLAQHISAFANQVGGGPLSSVSMTMLPCLRPQESRPKRSSIGLVVLPGAICIFLSSWNTPPPNMKIRASFLSMSRSKLINPFIFVAGPSTTVTTVPLARPIRCLASRFTT